MVPVDEGAGERVLFGDRMSGKRVTRRKRADSVRDADRLGSARSRVAPVASKAPRAKEVRAAEKVGRDLIKQFSRVMDERTAPLQTLQERIAFFRGLLLEMMKIVGPQGPNFFKGVRGMMPDEFMKDVVRQIEQQAHASKVDRLRAGIQ